MAEKYQEFTGSQKLALYVSMGALGKFYKLKGVAHDVRGP